MVPSANGLTLPRLFDASTYKPVGKGVAVGADVGVGEDGIDVAIGVIGVGLAADCGATHAASPMPRRRSAI